MEAWENMPEIDVADKRVLGSLATLLGFSIFLKFLLCNRHFIW